MPNERVPRTQYEKLVRKNLLKGFLSKSLHMVARNTPMVSARTLLYRLMGVKMGWRVRIGMDTYLDDQFAMAMRFEDGSLIEPRVTTVVHDDAGLSPGGPGAFFKAKEALILGYVSHITVRRGAIIGARAMLMPGVIVGEGAIVRPGAIVTKDVPAQSIVAGTPARVVGSYRASEGEEAVALLPANHTLQRVYDAQAPKSTLRIAYQSLLLTLARFTLPTRLRSRLYQAMGAHIGKDVYIGVDTYLDERYPELITFEDDCGPSFRATFITHGDCYDADGQRVRYVAPIRVKQGAWIGANALVYPGVTIGRGAVIGSGAVVTEDIPDYGVAVGNPARVIKINAPPERDLL